MSAERKKMGVYIVTAVGEEGTHEYVRATHYEILSSAVLRVVTVDDEQHVYGPSGWVSVEPV